MNKKIAAVKAGVSSLPFSRAAVARQALSFFVSLCLSRAELFGGASPFAAAFAAAAPPGQLLAVYAGACCGYLLRLNGAATARLIAVMTAVSVINYCVSSSKFVSKTVIAAPLAGGGCMLLGGITILAAQGFNINGFMVYLCESIICGGSAYFFDLLFLADRLVPRREPLGKSRISALLVSACILLVSVEGVQLGGISFARIASILLVLCAARWTGTAGGSIAGGTTGFAMSLGSSLPFLAGAYTFGGLLAGVLAPFGSLAQASAFAIANAVAVMMNSGKYEVLPALYETAVATVAFVMIPKRFFAAGAVYFTGKQTMPEFETMKKALLLRLKGVTGGLREVATAMEQITGGIEKIDGADTSETKQLVRDQFETLAMAVEDVSRQFSGETRFDTAAAAKVNTVLVGFGIEANEIIFSENDGIARIEISAQKIRGGISRAALVGDLENACGFRLNSPTIRETETETQLTFVQKPQMHLLIGRAQYTANDSGLCGDSCDCFLDKNGNQIIVLSDGMGTGPRAAVDGAVASWLFAKLLIAGLGFDSALRLSNSALIVKSQEESLATIDAVRVDMNSGKTEFFKAGAGVSMVCRGRKVYTFGEPSMPLGILREIEFFKSETELKKGDILLLMSDGVGTGAYKAVAQELRDYAKKDPSVLAEGIVEIAKQSCTEKHIDDITAVVVIVG